MIRTLINTAVLYCLLSSCPEFYFYNSNFLI